MEIAISSMMSIKQKLKIMSYNVLPVKMYMRLCYFYVFKKRLHLNHPEAFSEKLYWLKLYYGKYQREVIQKCYDKYTVREYVKTKIGEEYLNELYFVYDNANEIDFSCLPSKFVLKVSQSCGQNIICPDKSKLDIKASKEQLQLWLNETNSKKTNLEESYYLTGDAKIICEKYIETETGEVPEDYRIYCFNGNPQYIVCDFDTTNKDGSHGNKIRRNVYDLDWKLIDVELGRPNNKHINMKKPDNLNEMLSISQALSEEFPFVRVDLYNISGRIIFGELTWIPMGGNCVIRPDEFDYVLGHELILPEEPL